jgi:hypothetical protein
MAALLDTEFRGGNVELAFPRLLSFTKDSYELDTSEMAFNTHMHDFGYLYVILNCLMRARCAYLINMVINSCSLQYCEYMGALLFKYR